MCGIVGVVTRRDTAEWASAVGRSVKVLAHRGPDDHGVVTVPVLPGLSEGGPGAVLGNVRLAILDLSPAGHMPMAAAGGRVWITYNGELFNFGELRRELQAQGHVFLSSGDTEVVLHAYLEWGDACLPRLNGMFAFAIVDARGTGAGPPGMRCLVARDQLGVKPCYYVHRGDALAFASEIKGLVPLGVVGDVVDWQAVWDYFSYLYVPGPATVYADVRQLPPAHCLVWEPGEPVPVLRRYWSPLPTAPEAVTDDEHAAAVELRGLVADAVRRQLVSDVPLGVFLSGGIDSTILTALAAEASARPIKTFTVGFEGEGIAAVDDRAFGRRVAERYRTDHTELLVGVDPDAMLEQVTLFDQPFGNPTFYLSWLISGLTRRHVTVALSGAGGDELFGGYPRYRALAYAGALRRVPAGLGRLALSAAGRLLPENYDVPWRRRAKLLLRGVGHELPEQYLRWTYYFSEEEKSRLLAPLRRRLPSVLPASRHLARRLAEANAVPDLGTRIQYADLETFLADNILEYTDRTSMAVSLEARVPFLDPRVVEWSFRRPFRDKLAGGVGKRILKTAFQDLIPAENLSAPKRGFCPPLAVWMRQLDRYFDDRLDAASVQRQGIFDRDVITSLRDAHRRRRRDASMELFGILMFDAWWRRHVDGRA